MRYDAQLKQIADRLGIPFEVTKAAYMSFWDFIRNKMKEIPLQSDLTEEQFKQYRTSFNVPSLGKFACSYQRMRNVKKVKYYKQKKYGRV